MSEAVSLTPDSIEAVALRVVELLGAADVGPDELVDAAEIARRFHLDRSTVYAHADEWGAVRVGEGERPRLRFDPKRVADALAPRPYQPSPKPTSRPQPRRRTTEIDLLPIKGDR
jgi:hypothetical protein